jgi:hypothetical protein
MQMAEGVMLTKGKKALFGILAPLVFLVVAFFAVLSTSNGEGPSIGGRGMVLALILFPIAFVVAGLLNNGVLFLSLRSRLSAFFLGLVAPVIVLAFSYAYLWRIGPFQP